MTWEHRQLWLGSLALIALTVLALNILWTTLGLLFGF